MLLAIDLNGPAHRARGNGEDDNLKFSSHINGAKIDTELAPRASRILWAPNTDRGRADGDESLSQEVFYISMTEIEAIVEPDTMRNDIWRVPVPLLEICQPILSIAGG